MGLIFVDRAERSRVLRDQVEVTKVPSYVVSCVAAVAHLEPCHVHGVCLVMVARNVVDVAIWRVRRSLGADAWIVETLRGSGYRLRLAPR